MLGRQVLPVIADGKSDWPTFAQQAERLIGVEKVCTIFGCWTSASRKNVKPVVEKHNHLLIYPMAYEGLEQSPNIVYTGAAPNQQIIPAVKWSFDNIGKRFFLVGSDYVWPHSINAIIKDQLKALRAELTGEGYIFFGSLDVQDVVARIKETQPDLIFSSVVGDSNLAFYKALREAGIKPEKAPIISVSIGEDELRKLPVKEMVGNYAAWNYFQSINRPENVAFVQRFKAKYGPDRVTSDVIEAQKILRTKLADVTHVILLAAIQHSLAVASMLATNVKTVCVDIDATAVERAIEHQPLQSIGLVTDVEPFLRELADCLTESRVRD